MLFRSFIGLMISRSIFPSAEGISLGLMSHPRFLSSPIVLFVFVSCCYVFQARIKRTFIYNALLANFVLWLTICTNSFFSAPGRQTIYGQIPILTSVCIPIGIVVLVNLYKLRNQIRVPLKIYIPLWLFTFCSYFIHCLVLEASEYSTSSRLFLFLFFALVFFICFRSQNRDIRNFLPRSLISICFTILIISTNNITNNFKTANPFSDEVRSNPQLLSIYLDREKELLFIDKLFNQNHIELYATNSWCRYVPSNNQHQFIDTVKCDSRSYEISGLLSSQSLLAGVAYDYGYSRSEAIDNLINIRLQTHRECWEFCSSNSIWVKLGVRALVLDNSMLTPTANLSSFLSFRGTYFNAYLNLKPFNTH